MIYRYIPFVLTSLMKCARKLPTCVLNRKLKIFFRVRVRIRVRDKGTVSVRVRVRVNFRVRIRVSSGVQT